MSRVDVLRADAHACFARALAAVDAAGLTRARLDAGTDGVVLRATDGTALGHHAGPLLLVGAGKAALGMAGAVGAVAGLRGSGPVIVPHGLAAPGITTLAIRRGAHPVPDGAGAAATAELLEAVRAASADTLILVCLSGGASALLVAPAEGISLADKQQLTTRLLAAGADIVALNTVRKHCSRVKGGGLAGAAAGAAGLWTLVLSDVVGDDLATIASGPTVADPTTFADAARVLAEYLEPASVPPAIARHIARGRAGAVPETPKPGDPVLARTHALVVGGNATAVAAAAAATAARGYDTRVLPALSGDAEKMGRLLAAQLLAAPADRPVALVTGGETTVRVRPGGSGGRCQHLALAAALVLADAPAVLLAAGTDGVDGPTDAAGACVDGETLARARACSMDPRAALEATDSHGLLDGTGDLLRTGPTGTNVADVVVALRAAW